MLAKAGLGCLAIVPINVVGDTGTGVALHAVGDIGTGVTVPVVGATGIGVPVSIVGSTGLRLGMGAIAGTESGAAVDVAKAGAPALQEYKKAVNKNSTAWTSILSFRIMFLHTWFDSPTLRVSRRRLWQDSF